jgi:hypothetical protein
VAARIGCFSAGLIRRRDSGGERREACEGYNLEKGKWYSFIILSVGGRGAGGVGYCWACWGVCVPSGISLPAVRVVPHWEPPHAGIDLALDEFYIEYFLGPLYMEGPNRLDFYQ